MNKKQKRTMEIIESFQEYVKKYTQQVGCCDYTDTIIIDDMLYGLGLALDKDKYYAAPGYDEFKKYLVNYLGE